MAIKHGWVGAGPGLTRAALAAAVALALAAPLHRAQATGPAVAAKAATSVDAATAQSYIITFAEPGIMEYRGGRGDLAATAPVDNRFDPRSAAVAAYREHLERSQKAHLADIAAAIGRAVRTTHDFQFTQSGIVATLSAVEAARVSALPGVASVEPDLSYRQETYRGPTFIGADQIWSGAATPGNAPSRGEGVVIGILDSGSYALHPSFADDAACGFGPANHKLLSTVSCETSTGSTCNGPSPEADAVSSGHGVHTASIAGGNIVTNAASPSPNVPAPYTQVSGVAPCAKIRTYKVCNNADGTCTVSQSIAAVNNAIVDADVRVINFSIGGGSSPWSASDVDRAFLNALNANIFVAASAGNTSSATDTPGGKVNHIGPWVATVAASQQDKIYGAGLSAEMPAPPNTQNLIVTPGSTTSAAIPYSGKPIKLPPADNALGCGDALTPTPAPNYPADYFLNSVALIPRGTCSFYIKIDKAAAAGAQQVFIYNNVGGFVSMDTTSQTSGVPAYSLTQVDGQALVDRITANGVVPTLSNLAFPAVGAVQGDVLANFSYRGPTPGAAGLIADVTKPDITGPGVIILAGWTPVDGASWKLESGTSMSSPHIAGSAALVRAVHPDWTPAEVKSAMQLTAFTTGFKENGTTPWNADDVGAGRVDLSKAARAGFVLNETFANFLAANNNGTAIKALNTAQLRSVNSFTGTQTWTRTLRNTLATTSHWTVSNITAPPGVTVTVTPMTFTFTGSQFLPEGTIFRDGFDDAAAPVAENQVLTITAQSANTMAAIDFGQITFTEDNGKAPAVHMTVAVKGRP